MPELTRSGLTAEQMRNAAIIYQVGINMGMTSRDIQIALIAAYTESKLINVNYGDRDSVGLFQQRPSQGWGSNEQIMDPVYSAGKFFKALKGLGESRYDMGMGDAAQSVQRSGYPDRYATHLSLIRRAWPFVQNTSGDVPQGMDGGNYFTQTETQVPLDMSTLGQTAVDPGVPDASVMLGAWGMNSPQPVEPVDLMTSGMGTFLSQAMNDQVITPLMQQGGEYAQGVDGWRKAVIEAAKSALGTPYAWGGNSLQGGVDCSGLVQQAFAKVGLDMPRVSYMQANFGQKVGLKGLQPGDLYAWDNSSRNNGADHIAIYLGNGYIIEAPRPGTAVRIRKLDGSEGGWGVHLSF